MTSRDPSWMRGSSPLKGALLGLLLQRPGHGYDLANRLNRRLGAAWQIEAKGLYPMLQQLERAGLASSEEVACNGPTGRRVVYQPTARAQSALTEWMTAGAPAEPMRAELLAKLAVARGEDVPRLLTALDCYEHECRALLSASAEEELSRPTHSWATLAITLARAATLTRLRAELEWVAQARRAIAEFAASAKVGECSAPRRAPGRPARGASAESRARRAARR
jgi:DNA-binding PadR family transcriptional regulator